MYFHTLLFWILLCGIQLSAFSQNSSLEKISAICTSEISYTEKEMALDAFFASANSMETPELADIYYTLSRWFWKEGERSKGKEYAEKENALRMVLQDTTKIKKNLYNLGYMSRRLPIPDYAASIEYFDTLLALSSASDVRLGSVYREKGDVYDELGDFQRALENYYNSERIFKETNDLGKLFKTYINISATYANLKDSTYTVPFFKNYKKIDSLSQYIQMSSSQQVKIWTNLGVMYNTTGAFEKMLIPLEKALKGANDLEDVDLVFSIYNNIGVAYTKQKKYQLAKEYFDTSKAYTAGVKVRESSLYDNLADWYVGQEKYQMAVEQYQKAIGVLSNISNIKNLKVLPQIEAIKISPYKKDILTYLIDKSNCWLLWYQKTNNKAYLLEAAKTNELADKIIDVLYFDSSEQLSKLFWREQGATLYLNAVSVCYELGDAKKAFYYMEKNKGLLLLENINDMHAKQLAGIPSALIDKEYNLLGKIKQEERVLADVEDGPNTKTDQDSLKAIIFEFKNAHSELVKSLEVQYPKYDTFKNNISLITPNALITTISKNEFIVAYILGKKTGFAMLISKEGLELVKISEVASLTKAVKRFRNILEQPFESRAEIKVYQELATEIYTNVFPFEQFKSLPKESIVRIVADGVLLTIPFEALTVDNDIPIEDAYVLQNTEVYYQYSLSIAAQIDFLEKPKETSFAGFFSTQFKDDYLPSLPRKSIPDEAMIRVVKETLFKGNATTKQNFLEVYKNHNIVHLSTHGGVTNGIPWLGFYDKKLLLDELYVGKNQKELVVLSACKTAAGTQKKGEGVFSLTRGFINAGAKNVVATLWDVNEKANTYIMKDFYKELNQGEKKATALQNAKKAYLEEYKGTSQSSPYYWSAIISTGDNGVLVPTSQNRWYILFVFLIVITGLLFWKKRGSL